MHFFAYTQQALLRWVFQVVAILLVSWVGFEYWPVESRLLPKILQGYGYELQTYDYLSARIGPVRSFDERIRLVGIDETSLDALGQWPWSRAWQARLVDALHEGGARAVGFDVLFAEPSQLDPAGDARLAASVRRHGHVVLAGKLGRDLEKAQVSGTERALAGQEHVEPLPALLAASAGWGFIDVAESSYGVAPRIRGAQLIRRGPDGRWLPSLDLALFLASQGIPLTDVRPEGSGVRAGPLFLPTGPGYEILIPYLGSTGDGSADRVLPAPFVRYLRPADLARYASTPPQQGGGVAGTPSPAAPPPPPPPPQPSTVDTGSPVPPPPPPVSSAQEEGTPSGVEAAEVPAQPGIDPSLIRGTVVLVGAWAPDVLGDIVATPLGQKPGVFVHAMVLNALLQGRWIRETPLALYAAMLVGIPLCMIFVLQRLPGRWALVLVGGLLLAYWGGALLALQHGWWLRPLGPSVNLLLVVGLVSVYQFVRSYALLRQFITPELAADLMLAEGSGAYTTEKDCTIIFSDIRGFTTLNETMRPSRMVALLREYHTVTVPVYEKHGGRCLDYLGDAQMVVFGDQKQRRDVDPNHAAAALRAALEVHEVIETMNARWEQRGDPPFDVGLGCCSGVVAVGVLGADTAHLQYTVIGDVVNTAARVQGLSRELDAPVIATSSTIERAGERVDAELIKAVPLKGKSDAVPVYRVLRMRS